MVSEARKKALLDAFEYRNAQEDHEGRLILWTFKRGEKLYDLWFSATPGTSKPTGTMAQDSNPTIIALSVSFFWPKSRPKK